MARVPDPPHDPAASGGASGPARVARGAEDLIVIAALAAMVLLPLAEILLRKLGTSGIPGSIPLVQHLTLWIGFLGGALAARENRLLALATGTLLPEGRWRRAAGVFTAAVGAAVTAMLFVGAADLVRLEREVGGVIALGIPTWVGQVGLPAAFALIAVRLVGHASTGWGGRLLPLAGLLFGLWLAAMSPSDVAPRILWPALATVLVAAAVGAPIFTVLGGAAALLFLARDIPVTAILVETYRLAVNPTLPSIPLFTLAGFLLAEGRAPERLLGLFRAWLGWLPGGTAIVCTLLCAFFTIFTGGSGVTILALGGLLLPALLKDGYPERFSLGLLTGGGSLGLLLPPALPLILYAIVAKMPVEDLFLGGIAPGLLLVGLVAAWGWREGLRIEHPRVTFDLRRAAAAAWIAKWELLLPVVVLVAIFGGYATLVEASALAALYAFVSQALIHRDLPGRDLRRVTTDCIVTVGGVLVILGVAVGFANYLIDADLPGRLLEWTRAHVGSRAVFLAGLNLFLILVGCLMDIYSAIFVVVPLIVPIGESFGISPVHLGVIFIANLELGYLTPPVGLNLFLASYRFNRPILEVAWASLPMLAIRAAGVLLITYVPWLTTWLGAALGR